MFVLETFKVDFKFSIKENIYKTSFGGCTCVPLVNVLSWDTQSFL